MSWIKAYKIPFIKRPIQIKRLRDASTPNLTKRALELAINDLLDRGVIEVGSTKDFFMFSYFLANKKDSILKGLS